MKKEIDDCIETLTQMKTKYQVLYDQSQEQIDRFENLPEPSKESVANDIDRIKSSLKYNQEIIDENIRHTDDEVRKYRAAREALSSDDVATLKAGIRQFIETDIRLSIRNLKMTYVDHEMGLKEIQELGSR